MVNIPVKFKRVAEAFDDMARDGRQRLCESSGSEHSASDESLPDLSDLVNSFLERGHDEVFNVDYDKEEDSEEDNAIDSKISESGVEEDLMSLFNNEDGDYVKVKIHAEVEKAYLELGGIGLSPMDSKRRLMALLRERGLDAGLCKSKWDKRGNCPPGVYEYIDVIVEGTRYIIEVSLASEFEIARQTDHYTSLLQLFPTVFVSEVKRLKKIIRLMCNSIRKAMKKGGIHVPPWRRLAYMQAKWLGPYRRTINEVPKALQATYSDFNRTTSIGFVASPSEISGYCREDFARRNGARKVGYLAVAFATSPMQL
ncbi:hypothetical protein Leryth_022372 [Lithospermum erythrorhizon]|nr:hypothetical protein Leryth_022372 [Lithospermum erythrorhizon]